MAYREIGMWEILEVLRRVARGERQRAIARVTGHSRSTIRRWLRVACKLGWEPGQGEPDEPLARRGGPAGPPRAGRGRAGREPGRLLPHREQIQAWLAPEDERRGLRLSKVQQLLARQGVEVPYSSLHRFAVAALWLLGSATADRAPGRDGARRARRGRLRTAGPGVGSRGRAPARPPRAPRHARHSRHQYVYVTPSQKIPDLIAGLEEAWAFFGGVPDPGRARQPQGRHHEGRPLRPGLPAHLRRVRRVTAAS